MMRMRLNPRKTITRRKVSTNWAFNQDWTKLCNTLAHGLECLISRPVGFISFVGPTHMFSRIFPGVLDELTISQDWWSIRSFNYKTSCWVIFRSPSMLDDTWNIRLLTQNILYHDLVPLPEVIRADLPLLRASSTCLAFLFSISLVWSTNHVRELGKQDLGDLPTKRSAGVPESSCGCWFNR